MIGTLLKRDLAKFFPFAGGGASLQMLEGRRFETVAALDDA